MEEFKKLKRVLEKYHHVNILPSPDYRSDSFPASLAVFYSLRKMKKNVKLLADNYPRKFDFLVTKEDIGPQQADFLISIKEAGTKLSQLFYEKTENGLNLFLKTSGGELKKENVSFQPLGQRNAEELLITVGVSSQKDIKPFLDSRINFIVNIDNQPDNENFGQLNLVQETPTLTEAAFDILNCLLEEKPFDPKIANTLLAGIVEGTANFQKGNIGSETLEKASCLIRAGAELQGIVKKLTKITSEKSLQLFQIVVGKMRFVLEKGIGWVLLTEKDLEQNNSSAKDLGFVLEKFRAGFFPFPNLLILWEQNSSPLTIKGLFYSPHRNKLESILANFEGQSKGNAVLFKTSETDLETAKNKVLSIVKLN